MNRLYDLNDQLQAKLDEKNSFTEVLDKIEKQTKVKKVYQIYGCFVVIALYLMVGYGATFLANLIGFLYPAYYSIKAIESAEKDDDTKWLTYWVVYAMFSLIEFFADILLFWVPLYAFGKCIFLIFLMVPGPMNGSVMLYRNILQPCMKKYEKKIDEALDEAGDFAEKAKKKAVEVAGDAMTRKME